MVPIVAAVALCLCVPAAGLAQTVAHFAYVEPDRDSSSQSQQSGCLFIGSLRDGRFVATTETPDTDRLNALEEVLPAFPPQRPLTGVDRRGRTIRAQVESADAGGIEDIGGRSVSVRVQGTAPSDGILLSTVPISIRVLRREQAQLSAAAEALLQKRANELWLAHLPEREPDERPSAYTLKRSRVERIEGAPGLLVVAYEMAISREPGRDDRGSVFFIYSVADGKVVRSQFGHPEWEFDSTVVAIRPKLYFRLGTSSDIYFVAVTEGGWESYRHGIYDLRTGREVLQCY